MQHVESVLSIQRIQSFAGQKKSTHTTLLRRSSAVCLLNIKYRFILDQFEFRFCRIFVHEFSLCSLWKNSISFRGDEIRTNIARHFMSVVGETALPFPNATLTIFHLICGRWFFLFFSELPFFLLHFHSSKKMKMKISVIIKNVTKRNKLEYTYT